MHINTQTQSHVSTNMCRIYRYKYTLVCELSCKQKLRVSQGSKIVFIVMLGSGGQPLINHLFITQHTIIYPEAD